MVHYSPSRYATSVFIEFYKLRKVVSSEIASSSSQRKYLPDDGAHRERRSFSPGKELIIMMVIAEKAFIGGAIPKHCQCAAGRP